MRKTWKVSSPIPKAIIKDIKKTVYTAKPNAVTIILHWQKPKSTPSFPIIKNCIVCGNPLPEGKGCQVGYLYTDSGRSTIRTPALFDTVECVNKFLEEYQTPLFQNYKAKELFQKEHPRLWSKISKKTIILSDLENKKILADKQTKEREAKQTK